MLLSQLQHLSTEKSELYGQKWDENRTVWRLRDVNCETSTELLYWKLIPCDRTRNTSLKCVHGRERNLVANLPLCGGYLNYWRLKGDDNNHDGDICCTVSGREQNYKIRNVTNRLLKSFFLMDEKYILSIKSTSSGLSIRKFWFN